MFCNNTDGAKVCPRNYPRTTDRTWIVTWTGPRTRIGEIISKNWRDNLIFSGKPNSKQKTTVVQLAGEQFRRKVPTDDIPAEIRAGVRSGNTFRRQNVSVGVVSVKVAARKKFRGKNALLKAVAKAAATKATTAKTTGKLHSRPRNPQPKQKTRNPKPRGKSSRRRRLV